MYYADWGPTSSFILGIYLHWHCPAPLAQVLCWSSWAMQNDRAC